jgi:hypothetical protein
MKTPKTLPPTAQSQSTAAERTAPKQERILRAQQRKELIKPRIKRGKRGHGGPNRFAQQPAQPMYYPTTMPLPMPSGEFSTMPLPMPLPMTMPLPMPLPLPLPMTMPSHEFSALSTNPTEYSSCWHPSCFDELGQMILWHGAGFAFCEDCSMLLGQPPALDSPS